MGSPTAIAFALLHLAGVALVAWAVLRVARRFLSWPDMISQILLVAMVLNVAAYVPSTLANATDLNAREFAVVLPFGAVLAGRTLAVSLLDSKRRRARPALLAGAVGVLLAGYGASLGWAAAQPSVPAMNARLASVPVRAPPDQRHRRVLACRAWSPWAATAPSPSGPCSMSRAWSRTCGRPRAPGTTPAPTGRTSWSPATRPDSSTTGSPNAAALAALGRPVRTYHTGPYTVYVYDKNLLAELPRPHAVTSRAGNTPGMLLSVGNGT